MKTINQLKANRWRLVSPAGQYAGLNGLFAALVSRDKAQVFDGRDNEHHKIRFYSAILKVPFVMEYESCVS